MEDMKVVMRVEQPGTVTIDLDEYRELIKKAVRFDMILAHTKASGFIGTAEKVIFGLIKEDGE